VPADASEERIVRYALETLPPGRIDRERLKRMSDEEIEAVIADDPDAAPVWTDEDLARARLVIPGHLKARWMEIDPEVLTWFLAGGDDYRSRINAVLRAYVEARKRAGG
jgi:uncharacterized protein (DUF4415 family)